MQLKKSFLLALTLSVIGLVSWETYWRSQNYIPTLDDNKDLWSVQRAKVEKLTNNDVILTGSSRVLYDLQLDEWESQTGIRPLQLASVGSSPLPIFHDIVENTEFNGTLLVGVTPGLFFSTTYPKAQPWSWPQSRVDHYHNRTYAQRLNHFLSLPLQQNLVLMSAEEEGLDDNVDLKTILKQIKIGQRVPKGMPPFYQFGKMTGTDRNLKMSERTVKDTAFANTVKEVWKFFVSGDMPPPDKKSTTKFFLEDAQKFKKRGGNLILLRCPSTGFLRDLESKGLPRSQFWDSLLIKTETKGYHFEDYEQLKNLDCPEWSHLSAEDAAFFTTEITKIMKHDGVLTNSKTK